MSSFPPRSHGPSNLSQTHGNRDNTPDSDEIDDVQDDGAPLTQEEEARRRTQQECIMMEDLGNLNYDHVTQFDATPAPRVSVTELQRTRAVHRSGSEAERAFRAHEGEIGRWNNFHTQSNDDDGGAGDLDNMMDGQSHRARLRKMVRTSGGQQYNLHGTEINSRPHAAIPITCRSTAARRGRGGGVIGTRGRGGAMSSGQSTTGSGAVHRPLDPAVEPGTEYGLGRRRDVHRGRADRQVTQSPTRGIGYPSRGSIQNVIGQNVRGGMQSTTIHATAASRPPPMLASRWAPAVLAVNPLPPTDATPPKPAEAVANLSHRKENALVQKPVLISEPEKPKSEGMNIEEMSPAQVKPANATPTVPKAENTQIAKPIPGQEEEQRRAERKPTKQVPAHDFGFSPSTSKRTKPLMDIDEWSAGVSSSSMSHSLGSPEHSAAAGQGRSNEENDVGATNQPSPATSEPVTQELRPATGDKSAPRSGQGADMEGDLLDLDGEVVNLGNGAPVRQASQSSEAFADLEGLAFDGIDGPDMCSPTNVPEPEPEPEAVTKSEEQPEYVVIGGVRYYREDRLPRAVTPEASTGEADKGEADTSEADPDNAPKFASRLQPTDRLATNTGSSVGVSRLGAQTDTLLGERNLPRRKLETPATLGSASIWADVPVQSAGVRRQRKDSPVRVSSEPVLENSQHSSPTLDSRPAAIGERNLPGRLGQPAARAMQVGMSSRSSGTVGCSPQQPAQHPSAMPHEANPWAARGAVDATPTRPDKLVESRQGEKFEKATTKASHSTTDGQPATGVVDRSSTTTTSTLSLRSVPNQGETAKSSLSRNAASTSGGGTISSVAGSPGPKSETEGEKMVRVMNMKPWEATATVALPVAQSHPGRSSVSSTGNSVDTLRSPSITGKPTTNLADSKWAVPGAGSSSSTITPRPAKPAGQYRGVLNSKGTNANVMRPLGETRMGIKRTKPGPGFDSLMAAHAMDGTTSNTPAAGSAPTTHSSILPVTSIARTTPSTVPHTSVRTIPNPAAISAPQPRPRDVNTITSPGNYHRSPAAQHGKPEMMYRETINNDSDSSEL